MGNSMIQFRNKSLWVHDIYMESIIFFVLKVLNEKIKRNEIEVGHLNWITSYVDDLQKLFYGASDGALDLEFDRLEENPYCFSLVKAALISMYALLNAVDMELSKHQFDLLAGLEFGIYANWDEPLQSKELAQKIGDVLDFVAQIDPIN